MALKPGPKSQSVRPLPPKQGNILAWIERLTASELYPWQAEILAQLLPGRPRPRVGYVQVPRKNGKTRLAAVLALAEMTLGTRRHVYAIADSERNLNSVLFRELRDLVSGSEHLCDSVHVFKNHIEVPETDSFIETRPNNFKASQGINPHLVIFDEVHLQKNPDTWSGMQMAGAAREDALLFGITTPGYDMASLAHNLYQAAKIGDSKLFSRIYESDPAAGIDDKREWRKANPCYDRKGFLDGLEFDREHLPEHEFRRFRLGQWTATETAWLPYGAWDRCKVHRGEVPEGTRVWLGFDGSYSGDSTALVGVTDDLHVFVVAAWEKPGKGVWRVPRHEVRDAVEMASIRYDVQELICDPPYWREEIGEWSLRWPNKVVEFPTWSRARMAPACTTFYSAVMEKRLTHDGDQRLATHINNCIVRTSPEGDYVTKADKNSPAKIDLAVAAIIAYSRAHIMQKPKSKLYVAW